MSEKTDVFWLVVFSMPKSPEIGVGGLDFFQNFTQSVKFLQLFFMVAPLIKYIFIDFNF